MWAEHKYHNWEKGNAVSSWGKVSEWASYLFLSVHCTLSMNHISLKKNRPRCYAKSPTAQDTFRPIPGLISCTGLTGKWGLVSYAQNAVRWLALSILQVHVHVHTFLCTSIQISLPHSQAFSTCKQKIAAPGIWAGPGNVATNIKCPSWFEWSTLASPGWTNGCVITSCEDYYSLTQTVLLFTQAHPIKHLPARSLLVFWVSAHLPKWTTRRLGIPQTGLHYM